MCLAVGSDNICNCYFGDDASKIVTDQVEISRYGRREFDFLCLRYGNREYVAICIAYEAHWRADMKL
jgi:hypothetical protein